MNLGTLSLDQLKVLVCVEKTGSFSAAAHQLGRVQSAISQSIQALERSQGVILFDRSSRTPQLTDAGRSLVRIAEHVVTQSAIFENTARAIQAGLEAELSLAVDCFIPAQVVARSLQALAQQFPSVAVTVYHGGIWSAERSVRAGTAGLGLGMLLASGTQEFDMRYMMSMQLQVFVAPGHPLSRERQPATSSTLSKHVQLILTDPYNPSGPSYAVVSPRIMRFVDMEQRIEATKAGIGWANLPEHMVADAVANGELVRVVVNDPAAHPRDPIALFGIHERNRPWGEASEWLMRRLAAEFQACKRTERQVRQLRTA